MLSSSPQMPLAEHFIALSCISVGIGPAGSTSMVASVTSPSVHAFLPTNIPPCRWVSLVDYRGSVVEECFVAPTTGITDFRTPTTGLTEAHLHPSTFLHLVESAPDPLLLAAGRTVSFQTAQQRVSEAIRGKILIGHSIWNDLSGKTLSTSG